MLAWERELFGWVRDRATLARAGAIARGMRGALYACRGAETRGAREPPPCPPCRAPASATGMTNSPTTSAAGHNRRIQLDRVFMVKSPDPVRRSKRAGKPRRPSSREATLRRKPAFTISRIGARIWNLTREQTKSVFDFGQLSVVSGQLYKTMLFITGDRQCSGLG